MVNLNKSFIWGTIFASFTWIISLMLYWQLTLSNKTTITPQFVAKSEQYPKKTFSRTLINNNIIENEIPKKWNPKEYKKDYKKYVNSMKLVQSLQPVNSKSKSEIDNELNELGMVKNMEDKIIRDEGYKIHAYNTLVSQSLSFHREIPDTRNKLCRQKTYAKNLPSASIIICFYNEHFHTLIRTVHSILDRTPADILHEIILVDDFSDLTDLHPKIQEYIDRKLDTRVKLYLTSKREGLIRARMFGANKASGRVIVFLDSHVEVNLNWLEPLVDRISGSPTTVVMPVIDIINADTFAYSSSPLVRGGFNWGLHFKWENLPTGTLSKDEDFIKPIKSPTMAGGLFAMDRKYFRDLGEYDSGMDIWGGENLEISFRIWMCGGSLELIPCSRVGHVFRRRRPYGSPDGQDTMLKNSLRVAYVWMDEYKEHFLRQRPESKKLSPGDISQRVALRQRLHCRNFSWYLSNVYPELILPTDNEEKLKNKYSALEPNKFQPWHSRKRNYVRQYQIRLRNSTLCLQSARDEKTKGSPLSLAPCVRVRHQMWYETDRSELVLAQLLCLEADQPAPRIAKCHETGGNQEWKHKAENNTPIYNMATGTCLAATRKERGAEIKMEFCTNPQLTQWDIVR